MENYNFSDLITFSRTTNATLVDGTGRVTYAPNNLFTNSEAFEAGFWFKSNATVTANVTAAPNGTTTADAIIENTATATHGVNAAVSVTTGVSYALSVYAKQNGRSLLRIGSADSQKYGVFDLIAGVVQYADAGVSASIAPVGDGWYRCEVTERATLTGTGTYLFRTQSNTSEWPGTGQYTGNGTSGVFLWGAQLEAVTYQTTAGTYNSTSPANLLGFTQEFENAAWSKNNGSVIANATTAPNGTTNADAFIENTVASAFHFTGQPVTKSAANIPVAGSFYLKNNGRQVAFNIQNSAGSSGVQGRVNPATGTVTQNATAFGSGFTAGTITMTDAGNGWYRVTMTATSDTSTTVTFQLILHNGTSTVYTGNGSSGAFVWGAQLSNSASVDPYVYNPGAAPTSTAYYGPRFDHNPTTLAPLGLLIEEQRVNLALYSEQLNDATWTKGNTTVAADAATSPDGTIDADKLIENTANAIHDVSQVAVVSAASGATYSLSVFLKAAERSFAFVGFTGAAMAAPFVSVDLITGAVAVVNGTVTSSSSMAFANGWWRVTVTATTTATGNVTPGVRVSADGVWANRIYTGDGTSGIFVWGAQVELGAFPTSYIPTVASTVTRAADVALMTGANFSNWYNASEGTFVASAAVLSTASNRGVYAASDGSNANELFHYVTTSANHLVTTASVAQANVFMPGVVSANTPFNDAFAYRQNDISAAINGVLGTPDTSATIPTVNQLSLGVRGDTGFRLNGHIRSITFYPYRLADFQLQALTA